jgi:hypothetical protein
LLSNVFLFFDLTPERLQKQRARDNYGSACSGEVPRTGKERKKRLPERLRKKGNNREKLRPGQQQQKEEDKGKQKTPGSEHEHEEEVRCETRCRS